MSYLELREKGVYTLINFFLSFLSFFRFVSFFLSLFSLSFRSLLSYPNEDAR